MTEGLSYNQTIWDIGGGRLPSPGKEPQEMPVNCTEEERRLTAAVTGELDHHGAKAVMEELDRRTTPHCPGN